MFEQLKALHTDEDGAGATEYIVLLILIACVIIAVVTRFGKAVETQFNTAEGEINGLDFTPSGGGGGGGGNP